jgi:hypothetical protein
MIIVPYADDFIVGFEYESDARANTPRSYDFEAGKTTRK